MKTPTSTPAVALLESAIKIAGSARKLSTQLVRDERDIRRWLDGTRDVPKSVQAWLEKFIASHAHSQPSRGT